DFMSENGVRVRYLHSDIDTVERVEIIRDLRLGEFDVLVGINLLREGLDIPEVSLVAILDADKEGFLRSERSLIQTIGRAARHINGTAIMYADVETKSIKKAIDETNRRRTKQIEFNVANNVTPIGVAKPVKDLIDGVFSQQASDKKESLRSAKKSFKSESEILVEMKRVEKLMLKAAKNLEFEQAANYRDSLNQLKTQLISGNV
ncbi:MAG: helicase-related protein, partial [Betaproteobacteria bacterium]